MLKNAISKDAAGIRTGLTVEYATGKITNDGVPVIYTFANEQDAAVFLERFRSFHC